MDVETDIVEDVGGCSNNDEMKIVDDISRHIVG